MIWNCQLYQVLTNCDRLVFGQAFYESLENKIRQKTKFKGITPSSLFNTTVIRL